MTFGRQIRRILLGAIPFAALLLLWQVAAGRFWVVPSIADVAAVLADPFARPEGIDAAPLATSVLISLLRVVGGFALAAVTALPIGLLIGRWRPGREIFGPITAATLAVSPIAWLPIMVLVFGFASPASIIAGADHWRYDLLDQLWLAYLAVIWVGAFFPMTLQIAAGTAAVRASYLEAASVWDASPLQRLTKVILPAALPSILSALRLGAGISWRVIIAAEVFPGTRGGLGYMIVNAQAGAEFQYAFAAILVIAAIGLCFDAILALAARRFGRWQVQQR
ncbi:MAG: ABC transporter permease [Planctomycetota bacterium]